MPLATGDKLGPYEILAPLGAGGMGDVYRALDPRLNREVAIKVSRERFSDRFEREARAVAALNHPNICHLYDIGPNYLVMELIEGEAPKGPMALDEALHIGRQIASALDAAHSKGIVHRDLKPANIKIKPDGTVKVLDFGLAKTADAPASDPENSPTMTFSPTRAGMILGTAAYMSPEQARGKNVDKRADIWAFGVVLYELLMGARPFQGEDLTEILASVVKDTADLSKAPAKVRRLLASCLEKDPEKRLRDIGDAWGFLDQPSVAVKSAPVWPWVAAAVVLGAGLGIVGWVRPRAKEEPAVTLSIVPPPGLELRDVGNTGAVPEISPDGTAVLYRVKDRRYFVRRVDSLESQVVPGSEESSNPGFWSSDSTTVAFPTRQGFWKVRMPDGAPQLLMSRARTPNGITWNDTGTILLAPYGGADMIALAAAGGEPKTLEMPGGLNSGYNWWPEFVAGSEDFLVHHASTFRDASDGSVYLATLRDGKVVNPFLLLRNETPARYTTAGGGRILFVRNDNLYSQRLNRGSRKLEGEAELLLRGIASAERADFSVARNGTVVWRPGTAAYSQATEFDRSGNIRGTSGPQAMQASLKLSPNEKQLLAVGGVSSLLEIGRTGKVDLPKGFEGLGWIADGSAIVGFRDRALAEMSAVGSGDAREIRKLDAGFVPRSVSPDGKSLAGVAANMGLGLAALQISGTPEEMGARSLDKSGGDAPCFSPDGKWVVYNGSGSGALYVQPFPGPGPRRQISSDGGSPVWRGDGKEILFTVGDAMRSIPVEGSGNLTFGMPKTLFTGLRRPSFQSQSSIPLAVSRDGSRIFWLQGIEQREPNVIHVKIGAVK